MKYPSHVDRKRMAGVSPEQFFARVDLVRSYQPPLVREHIETLSSDPPMESRTTIYALTLEDAFTVYWDSRKEKTWDTYFHSVLYFFAEGLSRMCSSSRSNSVWAQKEGFRVLGKHVSDVLWTVLHTKPEWSTKHSDREAMARNNGLLLDMFRSMRDVFSTYASPWARALSLPDKNSRGPIHGVYPSEEIALGEHAFFLLETIDHFADTAVQNIWQRAQKDMARSGGLYRMDSSWVYSLKHWFEPFFMESDTKWQSRCIDALAGDVYSGLGLDNMSQSLGFFFSEDAFFALYQQLEEMVDHRMTTANVPQARDHEHLLLAFTASIFHQASLRARWEKLPPENKHTWIFHDCYVQVPSVVQKQLREAMRADTSLFYDALYHASSHKGWNHWIKQVTGKSPSPGSFGTWRWLQHRKIVDVHNVGTILASLGTFLNNKELARSYAEDVYRNQNDMVSKDRFPYEHFKPLLTHEDLEVRVKAWLGFLEHANMYMLEEIPKNFKDLQGQYAAYMEVSGNDVADSEHDGWQSFLQFYRTTHFTAVLSELDASDILSSLTDELTL